jgi:hypothetical protein
MLIRLVAGVTLMVLAALLLRMRARVRRAAVAPANSSRRNLRVYVPDPSSGGSRLIDVAGTVVSSPTLMAPFSGEPCALWEVSLNRITPASYDSDEGSSTVWVTALSGDLTLEYDARLDIAPGSKGGRPTFSQGAGGRVDVPGAMIRVEQPGEPPSRPIPNLSMAGRRYRPVDLETLARIGLPAEILSQVRSAPQWWEVSEAVVGTGGYLRLAQLLPAPGPAEPSSEATFHIYPFGQDEAASMAGCLSGLFALGALVAAVVGILLAAGSLIAGRS